MDRDIIVVAHNIRSCHNVGSLLRTAEGLGVNQVFLTGYTPYPRIPNDSRLPHIIDKLSKQINKTSLGAEKTIEWSHKDIQYVLNYLNTKNYRICALEQTDDSISLQAFNPPQKVAIIIGREVEGIEPEILAQVDICLQIPMYGKKESFNVVQATAMALYHLRFTPREHNHDKIIVCQ